jgi:hypothetical protein
LIWDIGQVPLINFDWLSFTPLWSFSLVFQLISEPVWSLAGFNRLCDPKATWRNVLLILWSTMARILVIEKTEPQLSSEPGPRHLGDHPGGVRDPRYTQLRDLR